jgi:ATP-binding cassette, subfamily F, member 3
MIQLTGAAKRFGPKTLFENFDWMVTPNERASVGYLPQEGLSLSGRTVFAECMTVFADLLSEALLDELVQGAAK